VSETRWATEHSPGHAQIDRFRRMAVEGAMARFQLGRAAAR
jgi:hypothetical protein